MHPSDWLHITQDFHFLSKDQMHHSDIGYTLHVSTSLTCITLTVSVFNFELPQATFRALSAVNLLSKLKLAAKNQDGASNGNGSPTTPEDGPNKVFGVNSK